MGLYCCGNGKVKQLDQGMKGMTKSFTGRRQFRIESAFSVEKSSGAH
jgi:hypothetical protein